MQTYKRSILTEEHRLFRDSIRDFITKEIAPYHAQWEKDKMVSREMWQKLGAMGFLGLDVPEVYGGMGLDDYVFNALIVEELARSGFSGPAIGVPVHSEIVIPYLCRYASEEMKTKYLPGLVSGDFIGAIAMTEPGAGSDLQAIRTTAVREGDHYIVNGSKTFITNGYLCNVAVVAVKTNPELGAKGTSLLILDDTMEGFTKGKPFEKIGMHAQDTCELFFDDVKVPVENRMGEEGKGFYYMMADLPRERIMVGLTALGAAEGSLEHTIRYVQERKAFGKKVASFQNTRFKIAELATRTQIGRVFMDHCITLFNKEELDNEMASMAKYSMTELQCDVIDECVQLHGGYGYMWEYFVARAYADARAQRIYAGSNEIMKELISRKYLGRPER